MRRLRAFLLALTVAAGLCGCGRKPLQDNGKLRVVCTLFPYYDFVRQIGGDDVDVTLVVPAGRETHSFEPTPLDVIRISEADVFVYNGGESEQWVENILDAAGENIPYVLSMMGAAELHEEEFSEGMQGQGANAHEHSDHDHGHGENGGGDDAEDEEAEYDEHIWTSPVTAMALCRAIGEILCQANPDHADSYRQRLADYLTELESLDQSFRDVVAGGLSGRIAGAGRDIPGHHGPCGTAAAGVRRPVPAFVFLPRVRAGLPRGVSRLRRRHRAVAGHAEVSHRSGKRGAHPRGIHHRAQQPEGGGGHRRDHRRGGADVPVLPDGEPRGF